MDGLRVLTTVGITNLKHFIMTLFMCIRVVPSVLVCESVGAIVTVRVLVS